MDNLYNLVWAKTGISTYYKKQSIPKNNILPHWEQKNYNLDAKYKLHIRNLLSKTKSHLNLQENCRFSLN